MPDGREYELKFAIDPGDCEALVAHPALAQAPLDRRLSHLVSTYYDTPDDRLRELRVSLRVRRDDGGAVQTLKRAGGSYVDREEWERASDGSAPDLAWLRETPLRALFDGVGDTLAPRFTVDVTRTTFPLRRDAAAIEAALDRGEIRAAGHALQVSELELESKAGEPSAVFAVARDLVRDLPLTLSLASKSERGFAVGDDVWGHPSKTIRLSLDGRMTRQNAFEVIVQACLHALTRNAALVTDDEAGEAVHKTRIALRRLRAAIVLFRPSLRRKRELALRRDIAWIAGKLGVARDADVLKTGYLEPALRDPLLTGAPALAMLMASRRGRAHAALRAALASPRWRLLLVELLAFSIDGIRRKRRDLGYRGFARRRLKGRHARLATSTRGFTKLTTRALHDVRKASKSLRYDLELFADVPKLGARRKPFVRLLDTLQAMQDSLGLIQDREAVRARLRSDILDRPRPASASAEIWRTAASAARVIGRRAPDHAKLEVKAAKAAHRLRETVTFR